MAVTRRDFLATGTALTASLATMLALPGVALAESYDEAKLLETTGLEDLVLGEANAPVTVIEYFSMTCGHCATFHSTTFKHLKEKYIDTGKMRFILREFPLDPLAAGGAMLARCAPNGNNYAMLDLLLEKQREWAYTDNPVAALSKLTKQVGFTQESFNACLTNQKLLDDITAVRERGTKEFGINSTPTFFVNGEKHVGALSSQEFDKVVEPLLK